MTYNKQWSKEYQKKNRVKRKQWEKEYRRKNLERLRAIDRERHWKNRDKKLAYSRKWAKENRELKNKIGRDYRLKNLEEVKRKKHIYNRTEQGKLHHKMSKLKRRELLNGLKHEYSKEEWENKINQTKGICPHCRKYTGIFNLTLDHIMPISKAPINFVYTIDDVQPLCKPCNSKKLNKLPSMIVPQ